MPVKEVSNTIYQIKSTCLSQIQSTHTHTYTHTHTHTHHKYNLYVYHTPGSVTYNLHIHHSVTYNIHIQHTNCRIESTCLSHPGQSYVNSMYMWHDPSTTRRKRRLETSLRDTPHSCVCHDSSIGLKRRVHVMTHSCVT